MEKPELEYRCEEVEGKEETPLKAQFEAFDVENVTQPQQQLQSMKSKRGDSRTFLFIVACVGNLAAFVCGISLGWTSPEIPKLKNAAETPLATPLSKDEESWIGSLLPAGAALGPFVAGVLADRIGRKNALLVGTSPFVAAFLLAAFATGPGLLFLARFLCGLAVGSVFTVLPMYIGEIADDAVRGMLGSLMQLFITVGLLFSYALGPYTPVRAFNYACAAAPAVFLVGFQLLAPESPYYLARVGDRDGAEAALMRLRAARRSSVQAELAAVERSAAEALAGEASFLDIFRSRALTRALGLSVALVALQQLSGINIVLFYAQDIFTDAGSTLPPEVATILVGAVQVAASAATPALVERSGKRPLLVLSAAGMAACQGALACFFWLQGGGGASGLAWLPAACLVGYIVTYCLGFGPLPWAVMGELFPGRIRSAASTATAAACWALSFLLTKYFGLVSDQIGKGGSFGIFALCCAGAAVFVFRCLPETTGKSLEEIQAMLGGEKR